MRIREAIPVIMLLPIAGFIAYVVVNDRIEQARAETAAAIARAPIEDSTPAAAPAAAEQPPVVASGGTSEPPPPSGHDVSDILQQIASAAPGNYLHEIVAERDSGLSRWPERVENPLHIWVQSAKGINGWDDHYPDRVREAFDIWALTGVPVKFTYVRDSTDADVIVTWVDKFDSQITGRTLWARDRNWWIVNGSITLALHRDTGEPLDEKAIHAIALHEIGHLLGLDHSSDTMNIMAPRVHVRDLSDADRATMRLLYSLPAGSLKH